MQAARIFRNSVVGPLRRGGEQRILQRIFGIGEIATATRDRAEHLRREITQQVAECGD